MEQGAENVYGNNQAMENENGLLTNEGYSENGAEINNLEASEEEFGNESNDLALENGALDNSVNEVVDNAAAEGVGDENVANEIMEANSAPTEFMPPQVTSLIPGGVVRYVGAGGTPLYDAPEGAVIKTLPQGDHPIVLPDGNWGRTSDGYFIPMSRLTDFPMGRVKQAKT